MNLNEIAYSVRQSLLRCRENEVLTSAKFTLERQVILAVTLKITACFK